jgi:ribosomal protein L3 glutamine methyltransferase
VGNSDLAVMEKWPDIEFLWPDFEEGGHGIFVLSRDQCVVFTQRYK